MKTTLAFTLVVFAGLLLTGCSETEETPVDGDVTVCPPDYLSVPLFVSPPNMSILDTITPNLEWSYPTTPYPEGSTTGTCIPGNFRLTIKKGPLFVDAMGALVDGTQSTYTTPPLEPGAEYRWSVTAMTNNENGPSSGIHNFFVGENCSTSAAAPTLLMPFNGQTLNGLTPTLVWQNNSDCVPYPYRLEVAMDADFTTSAVTDDYDGISTSYTFPSSLHNCLEYFWRVAAAAGTDLEVYSPVYTFKVATEGCEAVPGEGSINGNVWLDMCAIPDWYDPGDPLPFGCSSVDDPPMANGTRETGEPGIANVVISLGAGACGSSTPLGLTMTNTDGNYFLWGLQAGTYCVSINSNENPIWLPNGWWTYPPQSVGQTTAQYHIELATEEDLSDADFGWQTELGGANPYNSAGGVVFHDICAVKHGVEIFGEIPDNCVWRDGWVTGNGDRDAGEPGIPGVEVKLHKNGCANPPIVTKITDTNGHYSFMLEPGGDYCITAESTTTPNQGILQPGVWSLTPNEPIYNLEVFIDEESLVLEIYDFPWDYSNLPEPVEPTQEPTIPPFFTPISDVNCRAGPNLFWQKWAILKPGMKLEIKAINPARDWVLLKPAELLNGEEFPDWKVYDPETLCWVRLDGGTTEGDLDGIEIDRGPKDPTPTPTIPPPPPEEDEEPEDKPATEEPVVCSVYTSERSCQLNGCNWVKQITPGMINLGYCTSP